MSTTVQDLYQRLSWDFLEDAGLVLGTLTSAQFLHYLEEAVLDFCEQTSLVKKIFTQQIMLAEPQYTIPDDIRVQACFVGGVYLDHSSIEELYNSEYEWATKVGTPQCWFQDGLPVNKIQLFPIPDYTGTEIEGDTPPIGTYGTFAPTQRNFTAVGSANPTTLTLALIDNIPSEIPDSFTPYLLYRVMQRVFSLDGEAKDLQRSYYCEARWKEGISIAQAIMMEGMAEKK